MTPTHRFLSLGAGVQSSVLFLMACRGELPRLDAAILGDTQWKRRKTYQHLAWLIAQGEAAGIPVLVRSKGNLRAQALRSLVGGRAGGAAGRFASIPLYTKDRTTGAHGMVRRQCTKEYKLEVIRRTIRQLLGVPRGARVPAAVHVEQWIGISADETGRVRLSRDRWISHAYPLIYWCRPAMFRSDCVAWLNRHYPDREYPRSSCVGCPFHSNVEWRELRDHSPAEWADAVAFDTAIRVGAGMRSDRFLHADRVPLAEADLNDPDPNQRTLWNQECLGMCGV